MKALLILSCALLATNARAQGTAPAPHQHPTSAGHVYDDSLNLEEVRDNQWFYLHAGTIAYQYHEPGMMKITGTLTEIDFGFQKAIRNRRIPMFYGASLDSYTTLLTKDTYDGGNKDGPIVAPSRDRIFDLQGKFGVSVLNTPEQALECYAGIGIWALYNHVANEFAYERYVNYYYLHAGSDYNFRAAEHFLVQVGAQLELQLLGTVESKLSQVSGSSLDDSNVTQTLGVGYKVHANAEFPFYSVTPFVQAYFRHWDIPDSTFDFQGSHALYEPHNTTDMFGLNVGSRF